MTTIPGFCCGVCLEPLHDEDCASNYSDHNHDGYWCCECLKAYGMPRRSAEQHLRGRLHPKSALTVVLS